MSQAPPAVPPKNGTPKPAKKKPYSKPTLTRFGTLEQITGMVGNKGASDNGSGNTSKTHG